MDDFATILERMERELSPASAHDVPNQALFHYTSADGLLKILETREIWAAHYRYLNDREEMRIGELIVQEEAESLRGGWPASQVGKHILADFARIHDQASLTKVSTPFVASFSEHGDLLSQWRAYASNGAGYSLGLSSFDLPEVEREDADGALTLVKCQYDRAAFRETVRETLERVTHGAEKYIEDFATCRDDSNRFHRKAVLCLLLHAVTVIPRLKHAAFREENEWRLVVVPGPERPTKLVRFRASARGIVPYIPIPLAAEGARLPLARICIGPVHDPEAGRDTIRLWLDQLGYDQLGDGHLVAVSEVPYRG